MAMKAGQSLSVKLVNGRPIKQIGAGKTAAAVLLDDTTAKTHRTVTALVPSLKPSVVALAVIEDEDAYKIADGYFGQIKAARKEWAERMEEIIRPIRDGLNKLYKLNRDVDKPLADLESVIEKPMKAFQLRDLRRKQEEIDQANEEAARIQRLLDKAKTPAKQQELTQQLEEVESFRPESVRAENSAARPTRKVRITDLKAFAIGVGSGLIPEDCLIVHMPALNRYFKDEAEMVEGWPGVEGFDDVSIVSR